MKNASRRIFEELWNDKNRAVIDEVIASDYIHHDPQAADIPHGIEGYKKFVDRYLGAFPDVQMTINDEIVAGETVITRWTASGTHQGDLPALPRTGKPISVTGISIARIKNGKIVESWNNWDAMGMLQQLGAVSNAASGRAA